MQDTQKELDQLYKDQSSGITAVVKKIHDTPETSEQEFQACAWQTEFLSQKGFEVTPQYKGIQTAYQARSGKGGPHVCFMAEYDALPGIGHGCGHNLITGVALGAGILVKEMMARHSIPGTVSILGTPAEEERGGKIDLIRAGALEDTDVALMAHPSDHATCQSVEETGIFQLMVRFKGRTAHAAGAPEKGINALDAMRLLFNGVDAWRQQLPETCRIHGIIREGGKAPNIIPDFTEAEFYLRDFDFDVMKMMRTRFENIVKGAALMTDTGFEIEEIPNPYKPGKPNAVLNRRFMELAESSGMAPEWLGRSRGSSDFGDVTYEVPGIQPYFHITRDDPAAVSHSREFASCAMTDYALSQMEKTAKILATIALEFLTQEEFRNQVKEAFPFGK